MWVYIHSFSRCSLSNMPTSAKLRENLNVQQFKVIQGRWFWYQSKGRRLCHFLLLYLISKCALAIGRNRVTWRSINLVPQNVFLFVLLWGITKQIKTDVIGHYWKLFPLSSGNITLRLWRRAIFPKHRGNNFQYSDLNTSHYLYNSH